MSLLTELERRNVIRMAGLYLVGAWLVVQVASTMLPAFEAPAWALRAVIVALAIGFVPAMVFAWVFEWTPTGLRRDHDVPRVESIAPQTGKRMNHAFVALLALALTYFAVDKFVLSPQREAEIVTRTTEQVVARVEADKAKAAANGIAVLPFVNMSADEDNAYFSDGISEELLNVLVRVDGLQVASRTSSFAYKGSELGTRRIAGELGVSYVLEGSVRKSANTVRITAQLIDAVQDRHLWSATYDRDLTDIFAIQDEIANAIVSALRSELASEGKPLAAVNVQADTDNLTAYDTYLKARELFIARTDLPEATRLFERVVELDPGFARGWEGLGALYSILESWGIADRDYTALAGKAARQALQLDPSLSMPHAVLGMVGSSRPPFDWPQVLSHMDKAVAADPHNATAWLWRSMPHMQLGYFAEAESDLQRCLQVDPAYQNCVRWQASLALLEGDETRALTLFEQGMAEGFFLNRALDFLPALHSQGDRIGIRLILDRYDVDPVLANAIVASFDHPGWQPDDMDALLARLAPGDLLADIDSGAYGNVQLLLWFGAFDRLADAAAPNLPNSHVAWQRHPQGWFGSPQWKRFVVKLGFVEHWRRHGFPPHCRAVGDTDFTCGRPEKP